MKKQLYLSIVLLFAISCVKLDEKPDGVLTSNQYYKTSNDAVAAVNAIYTAALNPAGLKMYNRLFLQVIEYQTDDVIAGQRVTEVAARELSAMTQSTSNLRIEQLWQQHYTAIDLANIAIDNIPSIDMDPTLRTRLVNEAKFLRGLLYFNLVRLWGEVPLVLHQTTSLDKGTIAVSKTPVEAIYAQVITDFTDAEALPPTYAAKDAGRATGGAAKALLAKVYLTREEWDKASTKCEEVMQGPYGYALFNNYADVFNVATKNGKEHIFSAQCQGEGGNDQGNRMATSCTPVGIPGITSAGTDEPTNDAYNIYDSNDTRRGGTFFTSLVSPTNGQTYTFAPRFHKYWDPSTITNPTKSNQNIPVIRFAEILLIDAEALNEENQGPTIEAYNDINQVIRRAYGKPVNIPDPTVDLAGLDYNSFKEAVYLQRRKELMLEFQRWFDLVRTKRLITETHKVGKANASEKNYLLPIPQHEIDLNPALTQNPGWF